MRSPTISCTIIFIAIYYHTFSTLLLFSRREVHYNQAVKILEEDVTNISAFGAEEHSVDACEEVFIMEIIEYFSTEKKEHWLEQIQKSDWGAGKYLYELLETNRLRELCGAGTKVLLLVEGESLISFCTYAEQDDVRAPELTPWVGFVYTFPLHRGSRHMGRLLEYAQVMAKKEGHDYIYISTEETGLYEKYGYTFWKTMKDIHGQDSRIYRTQIL